MSRRDEPQSAERKPRRQRSRKRAATRAALGLVLVALALVVILTRSPILGALLKPRLSAILACDVDFRAAVIDPDGRIIIRGLSLSAPEVDGPAARFLTAERVRIAIDWRDTLSGAPRADSLEIDKGWIRVSQDAETNILNVETITVGGAGAPSLTSLPTITLRRSIFEFGQHDDRRFVSFISMPVGGSAASPPDDPLAYEFTFQQIPDAPNQQPDPTPAIIRGSLDVADSSGRITLSNVDLADLGATPRPGSELRGALDQWAALQIQGEVSEASLIFGPDTGVAAELALQDVSMVLPVPANPDPGAKDDDAPPAEFMTMRDVRGRIRYDESGVVAMLEDGLIEDLRYSVSLTMDSLNLNAPFTMQARTLEPFSVESNPRLLPFAPRIVRDRFATFSGPTALMEASVLVRRTRLEDGSLSDISYEGTLTFTNGRAAYEHFSYPVEQLEGHVEFDGDEIRIVGISGIGTMGAKLFADGRIAPPRENAEADIRITIVDVPVDELFTASLSENRREIVDALFDTGAYRRLIDAGLIVTPAAHQEAQDRLNAARIESLGDDPQPDAHLRAVEQSTSEILATPAFELAGVADLNIIIHRDEGVASDWTRTIDVTFDRAGILVSRFPYPAIAQDVRVAIKDEVAIVTVGDIQGLTGATGSLAADILLERNGEPVFEPDIDIAADEVPVDELLLAALPDGETDASPSPRALLRRIGLTGRVSTHAHVLERDDGSMGFDTEVNFQNLSATFSESPDAPVIADDIQGVMEVNERSLRIAQLSGRIEGAPFTVAATTHFPTDDEPLSYNVEAHAQSFNLTSPVERAISAFDPSAVQPVAQLRQRWSPEGHIDVSIAISGARGRSPLDISATLERADDVSFDAFDGRVAVNSSRGALRYTTSELRFDALHADVSFNGERFADARLDGRYTLTGNNAEALRLALELDGARFESPLLDHALRASGSDAAREWRTTLDLRGAFDAAIAFTSEPGGETATRGRIEPTSISILRNDRRIELNEVSGAIVFSPSGGHLDQLSARGPNLALRASGEYALDDPSVIRLDLEGDAPSLNDDLRALLPPNVLTILDTLSVDANGPLALTNGALLVELRNGAPAGLAFEGAVAFRDASAEAAIPLEDAVGSVLLSVQRSSEQDADIDIDLTFDSVRAAGLTLRNVRTRILSGAEPGSITIPTIEADAHAGRVFGSALLTRTSPEGPLRFDASLEAAGLRFAPTLEDLIQRADTEPPDPAPTADPLSRGLLDAQLALSGIVGQPDTRIGRGFARVQGGEVISLPLLLPLIELSNLKPPLGEKLDFAQARFYLLGDRIDFEQLGVSSPSIAILGDGSMQWPSTRLDLRLNSRGESNRIPLLSEFLEGLRDELATIIVEGTLADPEFSVQQLSGARRFLGSIVPPGGEEPRAASPSGDEQEQE